MLILIMLLRKYYEGPSLKEFSTSGYKKKVVLMINKVKINLKEIFL